MSEFEIRSGSPEIWPAVAEMVADTFFGDFTREDGVDFWHTMPNEPNFDWEHVRVGMVGDQLAAHVMFVLRELRVGRATLTFGGISAVMTHPDHRRYGYAGQLMQDALRVMRERGLHLTLLDGISRYYDRFGYATVWPSYSTRFAVNEAVRVPEDAVGGYVVRPLEEEDLPALLMLYKGEWRERPWYGPRTIEWLRWRLSPQLASGEPYTWVVSDPAGVVRGYSSGFKLDNRTEVICADRQATAALLRHTADRLATEPDKTVTWLDLPNTRTSRHVLEFCVTNFQMWDSQFGGWMGALVDVDAALDALQPELDARLDAAGTGGGSLAAEGEAIVLSAGAVEARLPQDVFLKLLFGRFVPHEIEALPGLDSAAIDLLKRVFPPQQNGLAGLDWF